MCVCVFFLFRFTPDNLGGVVEFHKSFNPSHINIPLPWHLNEHVHGCGCITLPRVSLTRCAVFSGSEKAKDASTASPPGRLAASTGILPTSCSRRSSSSNNSNNSVCVRGVGQNLGHTNNVQQKLVSLSADNRVHNTKTTRTTVYTA